MAGTGQGPDWVPMYLVALVLVAFLLLIGAAGHQLEHDRAQRPASDLPLGADASALRVEAR